MTADRTAMLEATEELQAAVDLRLDPVVLPLWTARALLSTAKEADRMREAVQGLFAGGFIDAGTRENDQWSQELEARLKPLRATLRPSEGTKT